MAIKKILTLITIFLAFFNNSFALEFSDFDVFQGQFDKDYIKNRIDKYLLKNPKNNAHIRFEEDAFLLLDEKQKVEFRLTFGKHSSQAKEKKNIKKIALDPGHFGGELALIEGRFIGNPKKFDEGTLTFLTALYLKELLEKEGFEVFLTRQAIGKGAYPLGFYQWLELNPELQQGGKPVTRIFQEYYNKLDLEERAKIINEFKPDLSLIIHYNAAEEETEDNFNLIHVPGSFKEVELVTKDSRLEFMRLLLTDHLDDSISLSKFIIKAQTKHTNVLPVPSENNISYLKNVCIEVSEGVWARNLRLTRLVRSPLCYGETLLQNNIDMLEKLTIKDCFIEGISCPSLVKKVAQGYFEGILEYCNN
jgi:N-acetylmuramoyl-L-alanine amidase